MAVRQMKFWNQHLTTKVAASFLLLALVAVGVVGGVAFFKAREALKQAAFDRLSVAATLKEEEINRWFGDKQRDFLLIIQFPDIQRSLKILLNSKSSHADSLTAHNILTNYLSDISQTKSDWKEIFILNRSNQVILSTNKSSEGKYETLADFTYFEHIDPRNTFAPIFYVSPFTGKPSVTFATPLHDQAGVRQGIIVAHLNLDRIDNIIREHTGLGKSGETYLVSSLKTKNTFISKEQGSTQEFKEGIRSEGIDAAMSGVSGLGLYENYAKVPVIGVYHWLNDQNLALLVEMHQEEAFAPARQLAETIVLVGLVSVGALSIGVYWLTQQLKISREQLENYSQRLEIKAQEAEAANRAKSEFLANMSHELRTPLNAILGFTQLITRAPSVNPSHLEHLKIISRSGEHLLTLINDVLSMAKIEAGRTTLNENSFDLYVLLDSLKEMLQLKAVSKGLQLLFECSSEVPKYVQADESKLRQVLINLLGNAIKFTHTGRVTLRVKWETGSWENTTSHFLNFEIEDTGIGIAAEELDRLFQPFVQTKSGVGAKEGTGLGLTISRQFVKLMGGDIRVTSTVGHGSTFYFSVKVQLAELSEVAPLPTSKRVLHVAPYQPVYRILIVDDRTENSDLLTQLLTTVGFETSVAANGQEAIAQWKAWHPHLIFMDMQMPVMDGYEATRRIRTIETQDPAFVSNKATVIIALTASAFEEQRGNIIAAGCDDLIRKPFQESIIFDKLAEHIGVQYVYAEEQKETKETQQQRSNLHLKPEDLHIMSAEWIAALHEAAIQLDADLLFPLLKQIPQSHDFLAERLTELVHNFQFDEIIELTQGDHDIEPEFRNT